MGKKQIAVRDFVRLTSLAAPGFREYNNADFLIVSEVSVGGYTVVTSSGIVLYLMSQEVELEKDDDSREAV